MNEPKLPTAAVDTERVIRALLDAFNSLTTASPSSPLTDLTGPTSNIECAEPASVFNGVENSNDSTNQIQPLSSESEIFIEGFCTDHELIERLRVTPLEFQALTSMSLLGSFTCKQDVLFMLRQIRTTANPANLQAAVLRQPLDVSYQRIEASLPNIGELAGRMRRAILARPAESEASRRFGILSSALGLMAATSLSCIQMILSLGQLLWPKLTPAAPQSKGDWRREYPLARGSRARVIRRVTEHAASGADPSIGTRFPQFRPKRAVSAVFEQVKPFQQQLAQIEHVLEPMHHLSELANVFESLREFETLVKDLALVLEPMHIFQNRFRQVPQLPTPPPVLSMQLDKLSSSLSQLADSLEQSSMLQRRIAGLATAFGPAQMLRREFSSLAEKFQRNSNSSPQ
jgi:hypothetical protein